MLRRNVVLVAAALGIALSACSSTSSGGGGTNPGGGTTSGGVSAGIGDSVRDGSFEFVVHNVDCGKAKIGSDGLATKAQGQFCIVSLSVENVKNEAQTFDGTSQYMFDGKGRKFSTSTEAEISLPESNSFLNDINPGNKVEGQIVFDIPKGDQPTKLELHDSPFSDGVTVLL